MNPDWMFSNNDLYSTIRNIQKKEQIIDKIKGLEESYVAFFPQKRHRIAEGGLRKKGYYKTEKRNPPLLTVITVVLDGKTHLERTMLSVLNQSYENIEYIIIDGGSRDGTLDIIKRYNNVLDYWVSEHDKGIYDAMNKGLLAASGEWINFLNTGDFFFDNLIVENIFKANIESNIDLMYGDAYLLGSKNTFVRRLKAGPLNKHTIKKGMRVCHQCIFIKRDISPFYDLSLMYKADYKWLLDIFDYKNISIYYYTSSPIAYYLLGGFSQNNFIKTLFENILVAYQRFGSIQLIYNIPLYIRSVLGFYVRKLLKVDTLRTRKK